jgi:type IV pilus assembly protein PilV
MNRPSLFPSQRGLSLIEVLITLVVVAFGLLGLAAFQAKAQVGSIESYQRAAASVLLQDMQSRMVGDHADAAEYVTTTPLGTGDGLSADCSTLSGAQRDKCEWSVALKGAAEKTSGGAQAGAMEGARGCVTEIQAKNEAVGVCTPAVYLVTVTWQGLHATKAPAEACGKNSYGADDKYRRAMSVRVAVGLPTCV